MAAIEILELLAAIRSNLFLGGGDNGVGMFAEQDAAKTVTGKKAGSGSLDFQLFEFLAALALEFVFGKRGVASEIGEKIDQPGGKFGEAGDGNGARIGAGLSAEIAAHAAQILLDLAACARGGSRANHAGRDLGKAGRRVRDSGVAAAEEKLHGNFRERVRFGQHHLEAIRESANCAFGPRDGAFGGKRRGGGAIRVDRGGSAHRAPPVCAGLSIGRRMTIARLPGTRIFCASDCTSAGVTPRKSSSIVFTRSGSPSNSVNDAR